MADAASRWSDADFPPRVRATHAIMERTQYSEPVVDYALDRLFESITATTLTATIEDELGSLDALDDFSPRAKRPAVWYRGVDRAAIVSSDTTIGVAIPHLLFALCAKATVRVKDRSDALVARFARTLIDERPEIAGALEVSAWNSDDRAASAQAFADARTVVAFGSNSALAEIRAQLDPLALFFPFGHGTSIGLIAREALAEANEASLDALARACALDALLYDGEGCLSMHALAIEAEREAFERFASRLLRACDDIAIEFPATRASLDARSATYRAQAQFRAAQGEGRVLGGAPTADYVITAREGLAGPPPLSPRCLGLYRIDDLARVREWIAGERVPLEAVAWSGGRTGEGRALAVARTLGASRLCAPGTLQAPPLTGNHGGAGRILPFVRALTDER